jgi:fructokinase
MFLCCGESLIDPVVTDPVGPIHARPGGGPANAARALARAGLPTAFFGGPSTDPFGQAQRLTWESAGVDCSLCPVSDLPTALAIALVCAEQTRYTFHLAGTEAFEATSEPVPLVHPGGAPFEVVHVGGLGTAIEPVASALAEAAPRWRSAGSLVSYAPNVRAGLESRGHDRASVERWVARADIVKVSTEDVAALCPDSDMGSVVEAWLAAGPALVVVTDGPGEIVARTSAAGAQAQALRLPDCTFSVGAGDAFAAGLLSALRSGGLLHGRIALGRATADDLTTALTHATEHVARSLI